MKKVLVCVLALVLALTVFAACGKKGGTNEPANNDVENPVDTPDASDVAAFTTIGQARALDDAFNTREAYSETYYVYAFELDGTFWRLTAALSEDVSDALWALEYSDPDYDTKKEEILNDLAVTKCENLNEMMLSEEALNALVGKTGADLLDNGWLANGSYNLEDMEVYMDYGPFEYSVVFESDEEYENTDDFDIEATIRPLTVKSVTWFDLGSSATDEPEE